MKEITSLVLVPAALLVRAVSRQNGARPGCCAPSVVRPAPLTARPFSSVSRRLFRGTTRGALSRHVLSLLGLSTHSARLGSAHSARFGTSVQLRVRIRLSLRGTTRGALSRHVLSLLVSGSDSLCVHLTLRQQTHCFFTRRFNNHTQSSVSFLFRTPNCLARSRHVVSSAPGSAPRTASFPAGTPPSGRVSALSANRESGHASCLPE